MDFFYSAIDVLKILIAAIGAGIGVLGIIHYAEGYSSDNPGAKSQGIKQLMAGGGIILVATLVVPLLKNVFNG